MSHTRHTQPEPHLAAVPMRGCIEVREPEKLPSTLSGLLSTALQDAEELDREHYFPYSENWHKSRYHCEICLAGAVIAGTLRNAHHDSLTPSMFSKETERKLHVIDSMRRGEWSSAFHRLYGEELDQTLKTMLRRIPAPDLVHFNGWDEFLVHLKTLHAAVEPLDAIDKLAARSGYRSFEHHDPA